MTKDTDILQSLVHDLKEDYPEKDTRLDRVALEILKSLLTERLPDKMHNERWTTFGKQLAAIAFDLAESYLSEREKRFTKKPRG